MVETGPVNYAISLLRRAARPAGRRADSLANNPDRLGKLSDVIPDVEG